MVTPSGAAYPLHGVLFLYGDVGDASLKQFRLGTHAARLHEQRPELAACDITKARGKPEIHKTPAALDALDVYGYAALGADLFGFGHLTVGFLRHACGPLARGFTVFAKRSTLHAHLDELAALLNIAAADFPAAEHAPFPGPVPDEDALSGLAAFDLSRARNVLAPVPYLYDQLGEFRVLNKAVCATPEVQKIISDVNFYHGYYAPLLPQPDPCIL